MKFFSYSKNTGSIHIGPKWFRISIFTWEKLIRININGRKVHIGNW